MRVIWTTQAQKDRLAIWEYIAANNPVAAGDMDMRFSEAARLLADHPEMGREGEVPGTRELFPHEHYRLVYEGYQEAVWVLTLVHTARLWPKPMSDKGGAPD